MHGREAFLGSCFPAVRFALLGCLQRLERGQCGCLLGLLFGAAGSLGQGLLIAQHLGGETAVMGGTILPNDAVGGRLAAIPLEKLLERALLSCMGRCTSSALGQ